MQFGIIGNGSWATALAKILTDSGNRIHWWVRSEEIIHHMALRHHNPKYLSSVYFEPTLVQLSTAINDVVDKSDCIVLAIPSAYVRETLSTLNPELFRGKKIISAMKGIVPDVNLLLNDFLQQEYNIDINQYFTVMGPCHAEEVASEKLSYLTFSGSELTATAAIAASFSTPYINTVVNNDITGVQYAAVLKNIYALGAGIAHGLEYGDNFLSVLIANCADEMAGFLQKVGIPHIEVGTHYAEDAITHKKSPNYAASVYLGDLLVTCYSLFSRNRTFGNMIGKGYSVRSAQLEMNMVAEGYNASRSIFLINQAIGAEMPIAETVYQILWQNVKPSVGFRQVENVLV